MVLKYGSISSSLSLSHTHTVIHSVAHSPSHHIFHDSKMCRTKWLYLLHLWNANSVNNLRCAFSQFWRMWSAILDFIYFLALWCFQRERMSPFWRHRKRVYWRPIKQDAYATNDNVSHPRNCDILSLFLGCLVSPRFWWCLRALQRPFLVFGNIPFF